MRKNLKHIIIALFLLVGIFGCVQEALTSNNYLLNGKWVVLNENTTIAKQIEFTDVDFIDENNQVFPFRLGEDNKLFIMLESKEEKELPFSLDGDHLTLDGTDFIRLDSPTYTQALQNYQDYLHLQEEKRAWQAKVEPLKNELLNAYTTANTMINDNLVSFIIGDEFGGGTYWQGEYTNGDNYRFLFSSHGQVSIYFIPRNAKSTEFYGTYIIPFTTYKMTEFISYGKLNNIDIPLNDNVTLAKLQSDIQKLNNITFDEFIKNSTLMLTPTWKTDPVSEVNKIDLTRTSGDLKLDGIIINNINPDTNEMLITLLVHNNANRSFIIRR